MPPHTPIIRGSALAAAPAPATDAPTAAHQPAPDANDDPPITIDITPPPHAAHPGGWIVA